MALIRCPECGNSISDRAEKCPHCGLPASYFSSLSKNTLHMKEAGLDYKNLQNVLISFERDHAQLFSAEHYISHRDAQRLRDTYGKYNESLINKLIFQYVCNNAAAIRVDIDSLRRFLRQMQSLDGDITAHNTTYVDRALERDKDYFDNILKQIDPNIQLDEEQRRAVITDDDYCLLVAGAGAGKTTTMAAKVKYLVEKKNIDPGEIIVISYTNKAIGELRDRINKGLGIPAKICTFHAFAYDIVKQFSAEPPEINFSSQQIIFDMLEKSIFHNKQLMRNLVPYPAIPLEHLQVAPPPRYIISAARRCLHLIDIRHAVTGLSQPITSPHSFSSRLYESINPILSLQKIHISMGCRPVSSATASKINARSAASFRQAL